MAKKDVKIHIGTTADTSGAKAAEGSIEALEAEVQDLRRELMRLPVGSEAFVAMAGKVKVAEASLTRADAEFRKLGGTMGPRGNAGAALLSVSQGFEDLQYGIRGVLNNIPSLVMQLGGTAGLAGVISIVAVAATQLWERFGSGADKAEDKVDKFKDVLDSLKDTLKGIAEFNFELNTQDALELMDARSKAIQLETTALSAANDAVKDRIEHERELSRILFEAAAKNIDRAEAQGKLSPEKAAAARDQLKFSATESELARLKEIEENALKLHQMKLDQIEKDRASTQQLLTLQSNALAARQAQIDSLENQTFQRKQLEEQRKSLEERISKEIKDSAYGAGMGPAAPVPGRDAELYDLRRQLEETNSLLGKFPTGEIAKMREENLTTGDANQGIASLKSLEAMVLELTGNLESIDSKLSEQRQAVDNVRGANQREQSQREITVASQRGPETELRIQEEADRAAQNISRVVEDIIRTLGDAANSPAVKVQQDRLAEILKDGFQKGEQNEVALLLQRLVGQVNGDRTAQVQLLEKIFSVMENSTSTLNQFSSRLQSVERAVRVNRQNQGSPNY